MDNYFRLLFNTSLILFPLSVILYGLFKLNIIKKDDPARTNFLLFTKKLMLFSLFGGILTYVLTMNDNNNSENKNTRYVDQCVSDQRIDFLNADQKITSCNCSHDYLFGKYGEKIYTTEKFNFTLEDNREILICFLRAKRPNLTDSVVNVFRSKLINDSIIPYAMSEIKALK